MIDENDAIADGDGWFSWNGPLNAGDPIWFDVLISDGMGESAEGVQLTVSVEPVGHAGSLAFDVALSEAVENDANYWRCPEFMEEWTDAVIVALRGEWEMNPLCSRTGLQARARETFGIKPLVTQMLGRITDKVEANCEDVVPAYTEVELRKPENDEAMKGLVEKALDIVETEADYPPRGGPTGCRSSPEEAVS